MYRDIASRKIAVKDGWIMGKQSIHCLLLAEA